MKEQEDAFGRALLDWVEGRGGTQVVIERDDGFIAPSGGGEAYGAPLRRWQRDERAGARYIRGRVLDVGCGLGRVALHLQGRMLEVVSIDSSPLAVEAARRRGVADARVLAFEDVDESLGRFDTIVLYGNNFGLFGSRAKAKRLLRRLHGLTSERGRIVAGSNDPYTTTDPDHVAYQERNRRRERLPGQLRLRPLPARDLAVVRLPDRLPRRARGAREGNRLARRALPRRRERPLRGGAREGLAASAAQAEAEKSEQVRDARDGSEL